MKRDASAKKSKLSCCKCIFDQIKASLAEIQPQNHQNVQKPHFWQKAPGVNGLSFASFKTLTEGKNIVQYNSATSKANAYFQIYTPTL